MIPESLRRHMLLRPEVIAELREVIERYPNSSAMANLRTAILHRATPELLVSKYEIAKAFEEAALSRKAFCEKLEKSEKKLDKDELEFYLAAKKRHAYDDVFLVGKSLENDTTWFMKITGKLIARLRAKYKGILFYPAKLDVPGYGKKWGYYCMQADDPNYERVERHIDLIKNGIEERRAWRDDWFSLPAAERKRRVEASRKKIMMKYGSTDEYEVAIKKYIDRHCKGCGHFLVMHDREGCTATFPNPCKCAIATK